MRPIVCCLLFSCCCLLAVAQENYLDTFIRKDGIYALTPFTEREPRTMFAPTGKRKPNPAVPLLNEEIADRVKSYRNFGKQEPQLFFKVLLDLELHDSANYYLALSELPSPYQRFFDGLYHVEYNQFVKALPLFDSLTNSGLADSFLVRESIFWRDATAKLISEDSSYNLVLAAYKELEKPSVQRRQQVMELLQQIQAPVYRFHRYLIQYNYHFRLKDFAGARDAYDSLLAYTTNTRMKASLSKNRDVMMEVLDAKEKFLRAQKNELYHYEFDFLYDHLEAWGSYNSTQQHWLDEAGFSLSKKHSTKTDSIFTRWLKDTSENETLTKFEVMSFLRMPLDKGGRRFVVVKLGFDSDSAFKQYETFLSRFRSKPIQQSILYNKGYREGNEYMVTRYFIAALYQHNDPVIKYELSLYLLEDSEGTPFAVDTLF